MVMVPNTDISESRFPQKATKDDENRLISKVHMSKCLLGESRWDLQENKKRSQRIS